MGEREQNLKELLNCFEYIKCYHTDMLECIGIILEMFWLKRHFPEFIETLITLAAKRKPIYEECTSTLKNALGEELYIPLNPHSNLLKILKVIIAMMLQTTLLRNFCISSRKKRLRTNFFHTPHHLKSMNCSWGYLILNRIKAYITPAMVWEAYFLQSQTTHINLNFMVKS